MTAPANRIGFADSRAVIFYFAGAFISYLPVAA